MGMKVRYEIKNLNLRVANVSHDNESYVLLRAYDDSNNEIVLELTHEQAGFLTFFITSSSTILLR
jgi:hypothetical protein